MSKYKRLTSDTGFARNLPINEELYDRLYELENAIENGTLIFNTDRFAECQDCPAWSGSDCTRHPYIEGCIKEKDESKLQKV